MKKARTEHAGAVEQRAHQTHGPPPVAPVTTPVVFRVADLRREYKHYKLVIPRLLIPDGVVALVGPSGVGKSTLLNLLGGLDTAYEGQIKLHETPFDHSVSSLDRLRRDLISFAPQQSNLIANLPVGLNVELSRLIGGTGHDERTTTEVLRGLFTPHLNETRLGELSSKFPSQLSVGERHRVAYGRALIKAYDGTRVLIADEPTANVDPRIADECFAAACKWARSSEGRLLLVATHDLSLAARADHVILIGPIDVEPTAGDGAVMGVVTQGSFEECRPEIDRLLRPSGTRLVAPTRHAGPPPERGRLPKFRSLVAKFWHDVARLRLLVAYFWHDIARLRELPPTSLRIGVVMLQSLVLVAAAAIYAGVPVLSRQILENDPALRLVEIESIGGYPVSPKLMGRLASLIEVDGRLTESGGDGRRIAAGVSPKRLMPMLLYQADGTLHDRWADGVRLVYSDHPDLPGEEQLFHYWGIRPLEPDTIIVTGDLLVRLGYDPDNFAREIAQGGESAYLYADERGETVRLKVSRIDTFPDKDIDILMPAQLAYRIEVGDPGTKLPKYGRAGFGPYETRAAAEEAKTSLEPAVTVWAKSHASEAPFECKVDVSVERGDGSFAVWVWCRDGAGLPKERWETLGPEVDRVTGSEHEHELGGRVLGEGIFVEGAGSAASNLVTLFLQDYEDVPRVQEYIDANHASLKLRVLNAENAGFVATVVRTASVGSTVILIVSLMFLLSCLVGIAYSYLAMLQRKLPEIGILRAYGVGRSFVLLRFLLEILAVSGAAMAVACFVVGRVVVPQLDKSIRDWFDAADAVEPLIVFGRLPFQVATVVTALTALVVCGVVWSYLRGSPAELLSTQN